MNETIRLTITLMIISILSAVALSLVYEKTNPIIQANKIGELNRALKEVLPQAEYFEEQKQIGEKRLFKGFDKEKNAVGLVVLAPAPGFQSIIKVLIGIDTNTTKITNVKILEHLETPGLGSRIEELSFLEQFKQQGLEAQQIDAITGATISSTAVIDSVRETTEEILRSLEEGEI